MANTPQTRSAAMNAVQVYAAATGSLSDPLADRVADLIADTLLLLSPEVADRVIEKAYEAQRVDRV